MFDLNPGEMLIVGVIAVLLFGDRLPEVAKTVGKHITDLKKGVRGIQDQITSVVNNAASTSANSSTASSDGGSHLTFEDTYEHEEATAPKFEPPPSIEGGAEHKSSGSASQANNGPEK